jgi:hypothetical protein
MEDAAALFKAVLEPDSEEDQRIAVSQLELALEQARLPLLQACAGIVLSDAFSEQLVNYAFIIIKRALSPTRLSSFLDTPEPGFSSISIDEQIPLAQAIFKGLMYPSLDTRRLASYCAPFLVCPEFDIGIVFSGLYSIMNSDDYTEHAHWGAIFALKEICESGVMIPVPLEMLVEILTPHLHLIFGVIQNCGSHPADMIREVVLIITALIRGVPSAFASEGAQSQLVRVAEEMLIHSMRLPLSESVMGMLLANLMTFYDCPDFCIDPLAFLTVRGACSDNPRDIGLSLLFWQHVGHQELRLCQRSDFIQRYDHILPDCCSPMAIRCLSDIHPWTSSLHRTAAADFVFRVLLPHLTDIIACSPDLLFVASDILCTVGCCCADAICTWLSAAMADSGAPDGSDANLVYLLCLHALSRAPAGSTAIVNHVDSACDYLIGKTQDQDAKISSLAICTIETAIRCPGLWVTDHDMSSFLSYLVELVRPGTENSLDALRCMMAIVQRFSGEVVDSPLQGLLQALWELTTQCDDQEVLESVLKVRELIVSRLPPAALEFANTELRMVLDGVGMTAQIPDVLRSTWQHGMLSILALLFRSWGRGDLDLATQTIAKLFEFVHSGVIIVIGDWITTLIAIVEALQEQTEQIAGSLRGFVDWVMNEPDPQLISQASPLIARLFQWALATVADTLPYVVDKIQRTLDDPECPPECYPSLLRSLAIILKAATIALPTDVLENCFNQYQIVWKRAQRAHGVEDVEYVNLMYQGIFAGLGALIYQARNEELFLEAHYGQWFALVPEFVQVFGFHAANDTLAVYLSFLADALEHLPDSCWLEIAQVVVRIPVILALMAGDDELSSRAEDLWAQMRPPAPD